MTDLADWAADDLGGRGWHVDGLYVATSNAGRDESIEFWRAAGETGLPFANPRLFPWTLANSPTGAIAKALDVHGPTYTLVGGVDAVIGAIEHAIDDLAAVLLESVDAARDLADRVPVTDPRAGPVAILRSCGR